MTTFITTIYDEAADREFDVEVECYLYGGQEAITGRDPNSCQEGIEPDLEIESVIDLDTGREALLTDEQEEAIREEARQEALEDAAESWLP